MKHNLLLFICATLMSCKMTVYDPAADQKSINSTLDQWHDAAANADFKNYFKALAEDAIFIGTDATENWDKSAFMNFAKPYFEKGKAWSFTSMERHIYFDKSRETAWFDELLNTQMKICRGSGVLVKENNEWKIKHYVLSMTIPNDLSKDIVIIKTPIEDGLITQLKTIK